jgi:long-chain fatty acid transport protein
MKRARLIKVLGAVFLLNIFFCGAALAGGISLYEFGSPDVGLAAAGWAARAQDASTVFTNPAGMSRLDGSQFLGGLQALYGKVHFDKDTSTTYSGSNGGEAVGWMPGGSFFIVQKINEDFSVGFGSLSYFGLGLNYDNNWAGRYFIQDGTLIGMTLTPAVSYRVNDWLSIGAGLNAMYGILDNKVALNSLRPREPDGQLKFGDYDWGFGWTLGILLEPNPGTRIGVTYLSQVNLDFSDNPTFKNLSPAMEALLTSRGLITSSLDLKIKVPQMIMFSVYHDLNAKWSIMGNGGWQDWSKFGQVFIQIDNPQDPRSLSLNQGYKDTWHVSLGTQYRPCPDWTFSSGIAYDSSAVGDSKRTVTVPMGEAWRFALGAQYAITPALTLGGAYEFLWSGDMSVDQKRSPSNTLAGEFTSAYFQVFALNLTWKY